MRWTPSRILFLPALALFSTAAFADTTLYFNGFEIDAASWTGAVPVASGTNGIASATGGAHGQITSSSAFTLFGGYNYGAGSVPTVFQPYSTSIDIYLNMSATATNDTRFDYSSAVSAATGGHLRDFVFNMGFYNDATGPGAGTDRFVISASNNTGRGNSFPKNPGRDPFAIDTTGWYTFEHRFYESGGFLSVDLNIYDASSTLLNSWTIATTDAIASVGGSRYGWLLNNEFALTAVDNSELKLTAASAVPEPGATVTLLSAGLIALGSVRRRRRS